ncbi:MAG: DNA mismatch repair protein MutS [Planctomycetes bacterium]|nr:DNA mismatch repair protein MutS [Planctomycetota bacterium]
MRQWADHKAQVGDAILLFRMGDFYETFYDDAKTASRVLGLTLTSRSKSDNPIPLAGIPYHALETYLARLVKAGFKVAISEQVEDPKQAKGVVKREVVRVVTPGTLTEDSLLEEGSNNYLAAVRAQGGQLGAACLDLATGEFFTLTGQPEDILNELVRLKPAEILTSEEPAESEKRVAGQLHELINTAVATRPPHDFDTYHAQRHLHRQFDVTTLEGFGYADFDASLQAAGAVLAYLHETQKVDSTHISAIRRREPSDFVQIDPHSWRSLEVERTLRAASTDGTLLAAVNRTVSAMGHRRLREALRFPLRRAPRIVARHDAVAELLDDPTRLKALRQLLRDISDIERITARLGLGRCSPRDLQALGRSLETAASLQQELRSADAQLLDELCGSLGGLEELCAHLLTALSAEAPLTVREGGIFAEGFDAELDRLRAIGTGGREWLSQYQAAEAKRTGIGSLKVGFNKVFGYYIEITHMHRDLVPPEYVRKQTVKNAERYITDELKRHETEVLTARDQADDIEYRLFEELKAHAAKFAPQLLATAHAVGTLDMLVGFACLAAERGYVRPQISEDAATEIIDGRHPALEQALAEQFVPNDTHLGATGDRLLIITGPNMSGKSTYIRQVALLTLLAQTGSFVPAKSMRWGVVDRIFTRVGASDELTRGQSTFMVEMIETANILNNATPDSLVILDELGRGTSTYDGLSLAWAVCEHISKRINCRTLFATHYHELTELASLLPGVKNYNVAVREWPAEHGESEKIVFLHRIVEGGTDKSYGVHVARIAGVPAAVIERSRQVLHHLESGLSRNTLRQTLAGQALTGQAAGGTTAPAPAPAPVPAPEAQLEMFATQDDHLRQALLDIDLDKTTPLDALQHLQRLQDEAQ